jgi:DNA polymerase-4
MPERSIIHLNVADFAVAVERAVDSRLRNRPVIIAPEGAARAAVYDMSEEAYRSGVRKGMALRRARRHCRQAAVLPPHPDRYERAMADLLRHALPYSPLVEMTDHKGHLFLDVSGTVRLFGPPPDLALRIYRAVRAQMGFDPIWAVATNKLVAKVATRVVKPSGEYVVPPGGEAGLLAPLPLELIPGIESEDRRRLADFNLNRAGQVHRLSWDQLNRVFGNRGPFLYEAVRGIDPSPVCPAGRPPPSVRVEHAFGNDTNTAAVVEAVLYRLVESVGAELRRRRLAGRRLGITLDYSDGGRIVRQATLRPAGANDFRLFAAARQALSRAWARRVRIRRLQLICDRLTYPPAQLELFAAEQTHRRRHENLVAALDAVRNRFGDSAVRVGRTLTSRTHRRDAKGAEELLFLLSAERAESKKIPSGERL